jgi:hypothetical protein
MGSSKGKRGGDTEDRNSTAENSDAGQATRTRNNRTGSKTDATSRRNKNEPGRYQTRNETQDAEPVNQIRQTGSKARGNTTASGSKQPDSMESAFDDEDIADESSGRYDADADSDIDWDDTPSSRGGRHPDE